MMKADPLQSLRVVALRLGGYKNTTIVHLSLTKQIGAVSVEII